MADLDLLLEAERRGLLPSDKLALLNEARSRGLIGGGVQSIAPPKQRTWGEAATDVAASVGKGIGQTLQVPGQLLGLITGDVQTEKPSGLQGLGKTLEEKSEAAKSESLRAKEAERSRIIQEAESKGLWEQAKAAGASTIKDPALLVSFLAEMAPNMVPVGAAARLGRGAVLGSQLAKGVGIDAAELAAQKAGTRAALGAGAVMQGADVGTDTYEEAYRELIAKDVPPDQAKQRALNLARASGLSASAVSLLAQKLPGAQRLEGTFAGTKGTAGRAIGAVKTGLGEAYSEGFEEAGGAFGKNLAMRDINPEYDLTKGVGTAAALGAIGGGGIGAVTGALQKQAEATFKPETPPIPEPTEPKAVEPLRIGYSPTVEDVVEKDALQNPVGNLMPNELTPEIVKFVNNFRKEEGKPKLKAFSIEDLVEAGAPPQEIDRLLAYKNQFDGSVTLSAADINNIAQQRNVDTETKGFTDFLRRATGQEDLTQMSQPQLHSAFVALNALDTSPELRILPEGTNAVRFTDKQYDKGLRGVAFQLGRSPAVGRTSVIQQIKDYTGLENDQDAHVLLRTAIRNGDLEATRVPQYEVVNDEGKVQWVSNSREAALRGAEKRGFNVRDGFREEISYPGEATQLPGGPDIRMGMFKEGDKPEGFEIKSGSTVLSVSNNEADANEKAARLSALREKEAKSTQKNIDDLNKKILASQNELERMEATGQGHSLEFAQLSASVNADNQALVDQTNQLKKDLNDYQQPVTVVPTKSVTPIVREGFTFFDNGTAVASFPTQQQAEEFALARLNDETLTNIANVGPTLKGLMPKRLAKMAEAELASRGRTEPGIEVKFEGTEEEARERLAKLGIFSADVQSKVAELEKALLPALRKLGLERVALNIVREIENNAEGKYAAGVIKISLDNEPGNYLGVLRHESIHALKELGAFTDKEWAVLNKQAREVWVPQYMKNRTTEYNGKQTSLYDAYAAIYRKENGDLKGFDEYIQEEAIAEGFRYWKPQAGMFGNLGYRLSKMFDAIKNAFKGLGFKTADSVFEKIEAGEAGKRLKGESDNQQRFSLKTTQPKSLQIFSKKEKAKLGKKVTVEDVGKYFDDAVAKEFGAPLDYNNKKDYERAVSIAIAEVKNQLKQAKSGLNWYEEDVKEAFLYTEKIIPQLQDPVKRQLFTIIAGIMSPQTTAKENWVIAAEAFKHYIDTGVIPSTNPENGKLWMGGLTSANKKKQLDFLNNMVQQLGEEPTVNWITSDHTVSELNEYRRIYGNLGPSVAGKATDTASGFYAFGPKIGPFVANLNGIFDVTVDAWMTRTFNRYFGTMIGKDGKIFDAPTEPQRRVIKNLVNEVAKNAKIKNYQVQSLLWFFEQRLFRELGAKAPSYGFSDGGKKFFDKFAGTKGYDFTGAPIEDAEGRYSLRPSEPAVRPSGRSEKGVSRRGRGLTGPSLETPLQGAPSVPAVHGPDPRIVAVAESVAERNGIPFKRQSEYVKVDPARGKRLADAYEEMKHEPQNPAVKEAYQNLIKQTKEQYQALVDAGYKFWFVDLDNPSNLEYISSPWNAMRDLRQNQEMGVFATDDGFGTSDFDPQDNPLFEQTEYEWPVGGLDGTKKRVLANDLFRAVHDAFGHGIEGAGFRADGEENAWQAHARLFTGSAVAAITSETRGQNSWVNFGPYEEANRTANGADTHYADQKVGLMPEWTWTEGFSSNEPDFKELDPKKDAKMFRDAVDRVKRGRKNSFPLHVHDIDTYRNARLFLSEDKESGFALIGDEIGSFFSGGKGQAYPTLRFAVEEGGRRIDAYRTVMPTVLGKAGFRPVARVAFNPEFATDIWDYNKFKQFQNGKPDLVFFAYDPAFKGDGQEEAAKTPLVEYQEALNLQQKALSPRYSLKPMVLGKKQEDAQTFNGVHYGKQKTSDLNGAMYGSGIRGEEAKRVAQSRDPRIKKRVYFYVPNERGNMNRPETGLGHHVYTQTFGNILGPGDTMRRLNRETEDSNAFESAVVDAGYDGYAVPNMGMMVVLNHDVPVKYEGLAHELRAEGKLVNNKIKYSLRATGTPEWVSSKVWDLHEKAIRADAETSGEVPLRPNSAGKVPRPQDLKREQVMTFRRLKKAVEEYLGTDNFSDVNDLMVRMNQESGRREREQEDQEGKYSLRANPVQTETAEFKQWFGKSKIVDSSREPKVMYHGTSRDITTFRPKQAGAIFVTDNPDFAYMFSGMSEKYMVREYVNKLSNSEKKQLLIDVLQTGDQTARTLAIRAKILDFIENSQSLYSKNLFTELGMHFTVFGEKVAKEVKNRLESNQNIMPVYVRAENPFDYENVQHVNKVVNAVSKFSASKKKDLFDSLGIDDTYDNRFEEFTSQIVDGVWQVIEDPEIQKLIKKFGHDGFYVIEANEKNLAVYEPSQIKSATGNIGTFDINNPDIRYSIRANLPAATNARINATTGQRKTEGFMDRILSVLNPETRAKLRAGFIFQFEALERGTKARAAKYGNREYMADVSATAAALESMRSKQIVAAAMRDGVPVYRNGFTTTDNLNGTQKGLLDIFSPLAATGDPDVWRCFQYYAGSKRGARLDAEGREHLFTPADVQAANAMAAQFKQDGIDFDSVYQEYQKWNKALVKYMQDTGVLSAADAAYFTKFGDYIPFYRQMDGEATVGPKIFSSIAGVQKPKALKGGTEKLGDFLENVIRNASAAVESGMKNVAANRGIRDALDLGTARQVNVPNQDSVSIKENGVTKHYELDDPLLFEAFKGLNVPRMPWLQLLAKPADVLRNFVTKDPGFILANIMRDSVSAWVTSGSDMKPVIDSFKQFGKILANQSPEAVAMAKAGLGGYEFKGSLKDSADAFEKALRAKTGTRTKTEKALLPVTALWDMLEQGSNASDMATRAEIYKRTLAETGNEAEALFQASEVMNFSRRGNFQVMQMLTAVVPFMNARIQGLDVLYRSGFGQSANVNKERMQKAFIVRSLSILAMSAMYWAMVHDDDEYKKLTKEERDGYWIVPGLTFNGKPFRFPIPFEIGVVFKVFPERILELTYGQDTPKDFRESITRNIVDTLKFNPIPQAFIPIAENITNHSFFTGEKIVGRGLEDVAKPLQYNASTSLGARWLGEQTGQSPIQIDNVIRGYTGTMGMYAVNMLDAVFSSQGDPVKATTRAEQLPVIKRFFASDSGTVAQYYDLKDEVDEVVRTVNFLERNDPDKLEAYLKDNENTYMLKDFVRSIDKDMKKIREYRGAVNADKDMSGDEKRTILDELHQYELALTADIKAIRKEFH